MGWNDHIEDLALEAQAVAIEAKAIAPCLRHEDILINQGDDDANREAFRLGTIRWKKGGLACERTEFMAAIKDEIDQSAEDCPRCENEREY
jgi:hypothetical protein